MAQQKQSLGLQSVGHAASAQLCQLLRFVDHKKVAAIFQCPTGRSKQIVQSAIQLMPCYRIGTFLGCGKIWRIGNTAVETTRRNQFRDGHQICAYTGKTGGDLVCLGVAQCGQMGLFVNFNPGNGTAGVSCAQKHTQCAAPGTQVQHLGLLRQPNKAAEGYRIGTQRKGPRAELQRKPVV